MDKEEGEEKKARMRARLDEGVCESPPPVDIRGFSAASDCKPVRFSCSFQMLLTSALKCIEASKMQSSSLQNRTLSACLGSKGV